MGIPLFITPIEPEVSLKAAEKLAAGPRSSIRRLRPVGRPRTSPETRWRRLIGRLEDSERTEEYEVVEPVTNSEPSVRRDELDGISQPFSSRAYLANYERMRMRDQVSFERQRSGGSERTDSPLPPAPESEDFDTRAHTARQILRRERETLASPEGRHRHDLRRMARRRAAPTPPYTEGDLGNNSQAHRSEIEERRSVLVSARSPSRRRSDHIEVVEEGASSPHIARHLSGERTTLERIDLLNRARENFETLNRARERLDALNRARENFEVANREALTERVSDLNRAEDSFEARYRVRQARLDGLGDRDRSLTPENATWETLLSGITPDPQPPSAGSSFASSAAAAASTADSGSASATTSMTSLDAVLRPNSVHLNPNDYCEGSDSASATNDDGEEDEDMFELQEYNRPHRRTAGRSYVNALLSERSIPDTEHWEGMQHIISRLTAREDIPDSWWAAAGLSRNLRPEQSN